MNDDFQLLNIAHQFPIDLTVLDRAYRDLQMRYHPDRFLLENEQVQRQATLQASLINDAYRRLRNPLTASEVFFNHQFTSEYLMHVTGLPEFLFHMLDMGEKIELAEQAKNLDQLNDAADTLRKEIIQNYQSVIDGFQKNDQEKSAISITHWKYLKRTLDNLEEKIDMLASNT